ncbi:MAG: hypothetical protein ACLUN5_19115 [Oscillospiraceae bacterium]
MAATCIIARRGCEARRTDFVVNYIEEQGLYAAWSLDTPGSEKKTVFRVLKKELEHLSAGEVHAVFKATHSGDRQKRDGVPVFDQAAVMRFLQMVREKMTRINQSAHICEEKTFGTIVERTDDRYRAYLRAGDEKQAIRRKKPDYHVIIADVKGLLRDFAPRIGLRSHESIRKRCGEVDLG